MDLHSKNCMNVGSLVLANIELGHKLEQAEAQLVSLREAMTRAKQPADQSVQQRFDAAVDARDMPSGAPSSGIQPD